MMISIGKIALFVNLLAMTAYCAPVKVFILSGQSNMYGFGKVGEIGSADGILAEYKNIRYYHSLQADPNPIKIYTSLKKGTYQSITVLTPSKVPKYDVPAFGPELGIAKVLTNKYPNEKIVLIKIAWGGTNLANNWIKDEGGTYTWFKARLNEALADIISTYGSTGYAISGIFWMQGESDATEELAPHYSNNLLYFTETMLRPFLDPYAKNLVNGKIPFIYGDIHTGWLPKGLMILQEQYRAQFKIPCVRCMAESRSASKWDETPVDVDEQTAGFAWAHYNTKGMLKVGVGFGNALIALLNGNTTMGCFETVEAPVDQNLLMLIAE
jgi:hypothetical protein